MKSTAFLNSSTLGAPLLPVCDGFTCSVDCSGATGTERVFCGVVRWRLCNRLVSVQLLGAAHWFLGRLWFLSYPGIHRSTRRGQGILNRGRKKSVHPTSPASFRRLLFALFPLRGSTTMKTENAAAKKPRTRRPRSHRGCTSCK